MLLVVTVRIVLGPKMAKKVLIIGNDISKYQSVIEELSDSTTIVSACSYHNLAFQINRDDTFIKRFDTGEDIREFSKILVLSTSPRHLENYIFSALTCFCQKYNIPIIDDSFSNTDGKLYALWRFWECGIAVAKTAFGPTDFLAERLSMFGSPCILKSVQGTKGNDSYLIYTKKELLKTLEQHSDTSFVMQNFIKNDGDWRIILTNYKPRLAIFRSSHGKDYRNNTSVGGDASLVSLNEVDPNILQMAIDATKALGIKIAGADILQDKNTGDYTVLEVNRTPQLVTGAFPEAKREVLKSLIYD